MAKFFLIRVEDGRAESALRDLLSQMGALSFEDNFETFSDSLTLAAGTEGSIVNRLRDRAVPREWLIVDREGNGLLTRGSATWGDRLSFKNISSTSPVTATIRFFR